MGKRGLRGKRGRKRYFSEPVGGVSVRKIPSRRRDLEGVGGFTAIYISGERRFPDRFAKISIGSGSVMIITGGTPVPFSQVCSRTRVRLFLASFGICGEDSFSHAFSDHSTAL